MRVQAFQGAFVSGEISPDMYGRKDLEIYRKAAKRIRNCYVAPQGKVKRREGLEYIAQLPGDNPGRLIAFEFNTEQAYLQCVQAGRLITYKDGEQVSSLTSAPVDDITSDMLADLNWTQSADTLILVHPDLQPMKVTRSSHTSWTATSITFSNIPTFDFGSGAVAVISSTKGWVRSCAFKYGRLWLCGLGSRPQTILGSVVGDYFNLNEGTAQPDEAINVTIDDDRVNAIKNVFPGRSLQIFTTGGEFTIQGALGDPVTPEKIAEQLKKATLHGANGARPVSVDGATLFVQGSGYVVRQFVFNDLEQSYNAADVSMLAPHLVRNVKRMDVRRATEQFRADYVYMVNDDGTMAVLNVLRDENLLGMTLFETDGLFEDVAVVGDEVYVIVQRTIDGTDKRFIERLNPDHKTDCSVRATSGSATTAWSGLDHLDGAEVRVLGDDYVLDNETVASGAITASEAVSDLEAGLFFAAKLTLLPVAVVLSGQSYISKFKRLVYVSLQLLNSRGIVVNQVTGETYKPAWRQFGDAVLNVPVQLFSGWKKLFLGGYDRDVEIEITQEDPVEFEVLGVEIGVGV